LGYQAASLGAAHKTRRAIVADVRHDKMQANSSKLNGNAVSEKEKKACLDDKPKN